MPSNQRGLLAQAPTPAQRAAPVAASPRQVPVNRSSFTDDDINLLARLIFAEGAGEFRVPGVNVGIGNTILNRVGAPGFGNTLQDVVTQRAGTGHQFAGYQSDLWNKASNPQTLAGDNATAYAAALALANDLMGGSEYLSDDPTGGATYFYSTRNGRPPRGFFTDKTNSGRLQETYQGRKVRPDPGDPEYRFPARHTAMR